jgi:PPE-repeat protein
MRGRQPGYRYEFLDSDDEAGRFADRPEEVGSTAASERGAGALGFAGTVRRNAAEAAGLATLAGDEFGGGPAAPMLPGTWRPDEQGPGGEAQK